MSRAVRKKANVDWAPLPESTTETLGREPLVDQLVDRILQQHARLLVFTGAPGIGKSRVAIEVARRLPGRPRYLNCEEARSVSELERLLCAAGLGETEKSFLVIDNPDDLDLAPCLDAFLTQKSAASVLVARRAPTGAYGEVEVPILPLTGPDDELDIAAEISPAERLLVDRAAAVGATWDPEDRDVRALCMMLDGVPLGLELAAGRARSLSAAQIRESLRRTIQILEHPLAGPARGGLASRIAVTYEGLDESDRALARRLSVFEGAVRLTAISAMAAGASADTLPDVPLLNSIERLVRAGLLLSSPRDERVRLLIPIRAYLREQLETAGEAEAAYRWHGSYYLQTAERAHVMISAGDQVAALEELADPNISAALSRFLQKESNEASSEAALALAGALSPLWQLRGTWTRGLQTLRLVLERSGRASTDARARAEVAAAGLALSLNHFEDAVVLLSSAIQHYESTGADAEVAQSLNLLGAVQSRNGSHSVAMETLSRALAIMRRTDDQRGTALVINNLGLVATARGLHGRAARYFEDALRLLQRTNDRRAAAWAMINLGDASGDRGDLKRAASLYDTSLEIGTALGGRSIVAAGLDGLAAIAAGAEDYEESSLLLGAAEGIRDSLGGTAPRYRASSREQVHRVVRSALGEGRYRELLAAGRAMNYDEAVRLGTNLRGAAHLPEGAALADPVRFSPTILTRREREVVEHLAHGLTNREISRALGIAPGTAARHVENILGKLGLRTRAQVTAWAHETGVAIERESLPRAVDHSA